MVSSEKKYTGLMAKQPPNCGWSRCEDKGLDRVGYLLQRKCRLSIHVCCKTNIHDLV